MHNGTSGGNDPYFDLQQLRRNNAIGGIGNCVGLYEAANAWVDPLSCSIKISFAPGRNVT
jgi:hypothetical protein